MVCHPIILYKYAKTTNFTFANVTPAVCLQSFCSFFAASKSKEMDEKSGIEVQYDGQRATWCCVLKSTKLRVALDKNPS